MRNALVLVAIVLIPFAGKSEAADCRPLVAKGYAYSYQQPVFLKQVYVPQYFQVGQSLQTEAVAEAAAVRAIAKLESRITALLTQREINTRPPAPVPSMPGQPPSEPPALPTPPQPDDGAVDAAIESAIQAIAVQRCVSCHSGKNPKTDLDLRDVSLVRDRACLIWARVDLGTMPPSPHEPLSNSDAAKFRLWVATLIGDTK